MSLHWIPLLIQLRSIDWIYSKSKLLHLWIEILFRVKRKKDTYPVKGKSIILKPGQFICSARKLAASINVDKDTVGIYLSMLESQNWIKRQEIGNLTLFTVLEKEQIPSFSTDKTTFEEGPFKDQSTSIFKNNTDTISDTTIYNKINKSSSSSLRETNLNFFEDIRKDDEFWEATSKNLNEEIEILKSRAEKFFLEMESKEDFKDSVQKVKEHLFNWLRKSIEIRRKNNNLTFNKKSIENGQTRIDKRRASDAPDSPRQQNTNEYF